MNTLAYLHFHAAKLELFNRSPERLAPHAAALARLADEHGLSLWRAYATFLEGWALSQGEEVEEGIREMERGLALCEAFHSKLLRPQDQGELAKALARLGRLKEAQAALDEAWREHEERGQLCVTSELLRIKGELHLLAAADAETAERSIVRAVDVARAQGARALELRAATSLARLRVGRGLRQESADLLQPLVDASSNEPPTPDLAEARRLIATGS